ncbi:hypothetical protein, partial [Pseudomonas sp. NMI760_13]|uniref:hypothetical protein n=1 Tax=Pseudomonas sp. NMI760_13 TaxID=2903147 RepID=UPI001E3C4962
AISRSGRRIIQRYNLLSTAFFTAADRETEAPPQPSSTINSLIFKEFFVPTSLEVGRIIRGSERASTVNFIKVEYRGKRPRQGHQVFAESLAAPIRPSAARAAHRGTRPLL